MILIVIDSVKPWVALRPPLEIWMEPVMSYRGAAARSLADAGGIEGPSGALNRNEGQPVPR